MYSWELKREDFIKGSTSICFPNSRKYEIDASYFSETFAIQRFLHQMIFNMAYSKILEMEIVNRQLKNYQKVPKK